MSTGNGAKSIDHFFFPLPKIKIIWVKQRNGWMEVEPQLFFFNWRIIVLQYCVGFCCATRISSEYTYIPSLYPRTSTSYWKTTEEHDLVSLLCCLCSAPKSHPTLCDPVDCRTLGSPVLKHCLPEFAQSHGHWVGAMSALILCQLLLFLRLIFPSTTVFSSHSALCIKWSKYWSFSFNISPSSVYSSLILLRIDWVEFLAVKGLSKVFSSITMWKHQIFCVHSLWSNSHICTWLHEKP